MSHKMGFTCPGIWNKLPSCLFGLLIKKRQVFVQSEFAYPNNARTTFIQMNNCSLTSLVIYCEMTP
jgi:hypothetical protein